MIIKKGYHRTVLIFPLLGIVIKIPICHFFSVAVESLRLIKERRWKTIRFLLTSPIDVHLGWPKRLFFGIACNWGEFSLSCRRGNPFLQPTYFSLLGLFNVQKMAQPCQICYDTLWCQLYDLTNGEIWQDHHHFENPENFCLEDGKLKILDYGSPKTQKISKKWGRKIFESFNSDRIYTQEEINKGRY